MGSVFALLAVVFAAYICVTAGAIAYELTGMDRESARFQALSAFTCCGFTTSAAERVVDHPLRRRITMTLIVMGWAGAAGVITTLLKSVDVDSASEWFWHITLFVSSSTLGYWLIKRRGWDQLLIDLLRRTLTPRLTKEEVPHEDLFRYRKGFGIVRIEVPPTSPCLGKTLRELHLPEYQLQVLLVEHDDQSVAVPGPDLVIRSKAHLVLFGRLDSVEIVFAPHEADPEDELELAAGK